MPVVVEIVVVEFEQDVSAGSVKIAMTRALPAEVEARLSKSVANKVAAS